MKLARGIAVVALAFAAGGGPAQAGPYEDLALYQQAAKLFTDRAYSEALPLLVNFSHICGNYEASNPGLCEKVDGAVAYARRAVSKPVEAQSHYTAGASGEERSSVSLAQANEGPGFNLPTIVCPNC